MAHDSKNIHMVGIKGQGMAALAELLVRDGNIITGSDTNETFSTDAVLKSLPIRVLPFRVENIENAIDLLVRSSAYGDDHMEIKEAKKRHIPVVNYIDAVAEIFNKKRGVLVAGTHGKTTTTAMIGCLLEDAGVDPTVLVGATVRRWGRNARVGHGAWMVAEGDEYQNKFLALKPEVLVITNIEYDHPDFFQTETQYRGAFLKLISSLPKSGLLIAEKSLKHIIKKAPCEIVWYGVSGKKEGKHTELNAKAALLAARHLGVSLMKARHTLAGYEGTTRRMEFYTSSSAPVVVIDDYAHHPTEIRTTLTAVRHTYSKRVLTVLFQPHTYSRTYKLLVDFTKAFKHADEVILLPIYSSAREHKDNFPRDLLGRLRDGISHTRKKMSVHILNFPEAITYVKNLPFTQKKRVIITLGAGDGWKIAKALA